MTVDVVNDLKSKFIDCFDKFRVSMYEGYVVDYTVLKHMIRVIENSDLFNNNLGQFLITYV